MWLSLERRAYSFIPCARVPLIPMINAPDMVFWTDSGLRGCSNSVDSPCRNSKHGVLARFQIVKTQQSS
eukprot:5894407-Pyramimonas_sp.AAC.1